MTAALLGYARVSTTKQDLERQLDALGKAGVPGERTYSDKKSGATVDRPGLAALLDHARSGDVIVIHTLDRLGRNLRETLNLIHELRGRGIGVRTLADPLPVDTSDDSPMGQVAVSLLALFAEMERSWNRERVAHSRAVAAAAGRQVGRPKSVSDKRIRHALRLREDERWTVADIVRETGIPSATLYRRWAELRSTEEMETADAPS